MHTIPFPRDISVRRMAELLGVPARTARGWKQRGRAPAHWCLLLLILDRKDLGVLDHAWRGWTLQRGQLYSPDQLGFTPGEVAATPFLHQLEAEYRRQLARPQQRALTLD